jgi:hypothetical protein
MAYRSAAQVAEEKRKNDLRHWFAVLRRAAYISGQYPRYAHVKFIVFTGAESHAAWVRDGKFLATTPIPPEALAQAA